LNLSDKIHRIEKELRKGSVVFKEWNSAKRMKVIEIQPGAKLAFGKIEKQEIVASMSASGKIEKLAASNDLQFVLLDGRLDELIAQGSALVKVIESSIESGF
jgi:hypothetical protein